MAASSGSTMPGWWHGKARSDRTDTRSDRARPPTMRERALACDERGGAFES